MQEGGAALQAQANRPDWAQDGRGLEQQNRFESSLEDFHSTIDQVGIVIISLDDFHWPDGTQFEVCTGNNWTKPVKSTLHASPSSFLPTGSHVPKYLSHNCDPGTLPLSSTLGQLSSKWPSQLGFEKCYELLPRTFVIISLLRSRASIILGYDKLCG